MDHFERGGPLEARPDTLRYRLGKFTARNRRVHRGRGLALLVVVALVVFFTFRLAKARSSTLAEAARAQRIQQFMLNLFEGGDKAVGPPGRCAWRPCSTAAPRRPARSTASPLFRPNFTPRSEACTRSSGDLTAPTAAAVGVGPAPACSRPRNPEVAESLVAIGLLRVDQARLEEAERLVREGLELRSERFPPMTPAIAEATTALGKVLEERGQYDQAVKVLEEAVRLRSTQAAGSPELADALLELANTHFYAGHYRDADSLNQRVLAMHRRLYGDRHARIATI